MAQNRRNHRQGPAAASPGPSPFLVDPKVDFAFKKIFGQPENRDILAAFLNAVLKLEHSSRFTAEGLELLNPIHDRTHADDKYCVLDIHARDLSGTRVHIEIQLVNHYDMHIRPLYYWSRIFSGLLKAGQDYLSLEKTISINILNFDLLAGLEKYHSVFHLWEDEARWKLNDLAEFHYFELPKLEATQVAIDAPEVKWLLYLKGVSDEALRQLAEGEPMLEKARTVQELLSQDKHERALYEARLKALLDEEARSGRLRRLEEQLRQKEEKLRLEEEARQQAEARQRVEAEARQQAEARQRAEADARKQAEDALRAARQEQLTMMRAAARSALEARFGAKAGALSCLLDRIEAPVTLQHLLPGLFQASSPEEAAELMEAAVRSEAR